MPKRQTQGRNNTLTLVDTVAGAVDDDVPLPDGVVLRSDSEREIWRQFTRARARASWRDLDLVILAKAVRLESDIRKHQETLDRSGPIIRNDRGTPIPNPLLNIIDSLQRQQLALFRSLSLAQVEVGDPRQPNNAGMAANRFRQIFNSNPNLARPD